MGEILYKGRSLNTAPEDVCYENEARNMRVGDAGGKNLIPYPYSHKSGNYNGVEITINDDYSISLNGTNTGNRNDFGFAGISRIADIPYMVSLKAGKSYTLSLEFFRGSLPDTSDVVINGWNDNSVVMLLAVCDSSVTSFTFTVPADSGIKHGCVYLQNKSGTVFDNVRLRPMLTEGNEVVPYEPYIPSVKMLADENEQQSNEILDAKMLGWTVPRECPVQNYVDSDGVFHQRVGRVDLGNLDWNYHSGYKRFETIGITDYKKKDSTNTWVADAFLKGYSTTTGNNTANDGYDKTIGFNGTSKTFCVKNTSYTDTTTFKNAMQGKYLYYELETEIKKNVDGNECIEEVNENLSVIGKCKNLFDATIETVTKNGVTCTNNGDGTYTVNGTAVNDNAWFESNDITGLKNGVTYKIIGDPSGVVKDFLYSYIYDKTAQKSINPILGQHTFVYDSSHIYNFRIKVAKNQTASNKIFKPMLTTNLNATYDDFVPYTGDGDTLAADVAELNEKFNNYQENLSLNIFTGNIDEMGTENGLPETSSRCWCQASKVTGTLPFTTDNSSNMYFLLMTDVATKSGSTSIRTQKAVVFKNKSEDIYERLFVNLKWKDWQKTNKDETKTTSISLPYGLTCSISYNSNNVHMKITGKLTSDIDISNDYVTIGTISDDNLKPKLNYQEYKIFTSSKSAQVIISIDGEIKVGYGHTLIDYSNAGLVTGESVLVEMNYIV